MLVALLSRKKRKTERLFLSGHLLNSDLNFKER
jgi:hypothetical protein